MSGILVSINEGFTLILVEHNSRAEVEFINNTDGCSLSVKQIKQRAIAILQVL